MQIAVEYLLKTFLKTKFHGQEKKEEEEVKSSHPHIDFGHFEKF